MKPRLTTFAEIEEELRRLGYQTDEELDPAWAALVFAALDQPGISVESYVNQLKKLAEEVGEDFSRRRKRGEPDNLDTRIAALGHTLAGSWGFVAGGDAATAESDPDREDDLQNASLIRVIDRRTGFSEALGILYIHAARAQGWTAEGLKFPARFVLRLEHAGERAIIDPLNGGRRLEAPDLRNLLKAYTDKGAELSHDYYNAIDNREIVLRLMNRIKLHMIAGEDFIGAADLVEHMRDFSPGETRLLLDAGVLLARTGKPDRAIAALERYVAETDDPHGRYEAELLLDQLKAGII